MSKQQVKLLSSEFQPKNEYLLIKPADVETEKTSSGGIIIPLGKVGPEARSTSGDVISVGSDIDDIKRGDFVLWPNTDGLDIEFTDGEFLLLRYASVIGSKSV